MSTLKKPWINTPLIWSRTLSQEAGCNTYLKLENLQPSGSFKSRGVGNYVRSHLLSNRSSTSNSNISQAHNEQSSNGVTNYDAKSTHFFCSSGGNAGLGCVHAAVTLGSPATIVVPTSTTDYMITKLREAGAREVVQHGASWAEADQHLREVVLPKAQQAGETAVYVPPFDAQPIWDGNATLLDEIVEQLKDVDQSYPTTTASSSSDDASTDLEAIICSVGGGGLFTGIMQGLNTHNLASSTKVISAETVGADCLNKSVAVGQNITLPGITSIATSLGARTLAAKAFEYAMDTKRTRSVVVSDAQAVKACRRFADEEHMLVEPACGASLAVCYEGLLKDCLPELRSDSRVVIVVCGGSNVSMEILSKYVAKFGV